MRKQRLFTPGPTPQMPAAQAAAALPILHHRTPEFRDLLQQVQSHLQKLFKTRNDVVILTCSGTGAMEAAVANSTRPSGTALAVVAGKFGERWVQICSSLNRPCLSLEKKSGEAAGVDEICRQLEAHPEVDCLLLQGCETSTGTMHDLEQIAKAVRRDHPEVLIVVDAITALASQPVETDEWGLDVVIGGSQKSFAMSPGLAFVSLSQRALSRMSAHGSYYFDLTREVMHQREGKTAFTPAVTLIQSLRAATLEILDQGLDAVIMEAARMAAATRAGLLALECTLLSVSPSNATTAAFPPEGIAAADLIRRTEENFGVKLAGGQGDLKGRIFRIAHLGYFDVLDVVAVLSAIELVLKDLTGRSADGRGVRAALQAWCS